MPRPAPTGLTVRAATPDELDIVARVRSRCYRASHADEENLREGIARDRGDAAAGDMLLAEKDGRFVATTTCLRGQMNVRGKLFDCNGIAWVGTTHDARRSGGVASAIMRHALDIARDRGEVLSALMPFRASYYEHFGYGLCERRANWTIPIPILPQGPKGEELSFRFVEPGDEAMHLQLAAARRRQFEDSQLGHGDVTFPHAELDGFRHWADWYDEQGYLFADLADDGHVRGWLGVHPVTNDGHRGLNAMHSIYDSPAGLLRQLQFLATLRDQYGFVEIATPADVSLNVLLKESQLPHRGVEHDHATCEITARNQVRVLDHLAFLNDLPWPDARAAGKVVVAVKETEGHTSTFALDVSDGRCEATNSEATPQFTCADKIWAPIALGEFPASFAARHGLAECDDEAVLPLLDTLSHGPLPFCREYF